MNSLNLAKTLDQLCHAEQRSMIPRLRECRVFIGWASADDGDAVDSMVDEEREHVAWLVDMINGLGEAPTPWIADMRTTSLHFVQLSYLMPQATADKVNLIHLYERHLAELNDDPQAARLVDRIIQRHRAHLQTLEAMGRQAVEAAPDGGAPSA